MSDPVTVLIVDDKEDARWALSTFVRKVGFVPLLAASGRDALATPCQRSGLMRCCSMFACLI